MTCDNPAQAYCEVRRVARRAHQCCECGNSILAGDTYKYISGVWDNQGASFKTCWPCVAFRNMDRRINAGWRGYEEPYISQLFEGWPTEELPAHHPDYEAAA